MRERDDDVELLAQQSAQLVLGLGEAARRERRPLRVERERLALRQRGQLGRPVERDRRQSPPPPRPPAPRRATRRGRARGRTPARDRRAPRAPALLPVVGPEVDLDELAPPLGGRDRSSPASTGAQRALRERRERADLLDLVAEELDPERLAAGRREDVDEPAAHRELAALLDPLDPLVAGGGELLGERVDPGLVARRDAKRRGPLARPAARLRRRAVADAQTSPPRSSTASARARSPTRCGGGSSPEPQRTPREGKSATFSSPRNQPAASAASRASASSGSTHDEAALQLVVQRREDERQDRLRDAGARRQRGGELLEPLLRAEAFDEAVENGTVHDDGPNEAFGRVVMVRGQTQSASAVVAAGVPASRASRSRRACRCAGRG